MLNDRDAGLDRSEDYTGLFLLYIPFLFFCAPKRNTFTYRLIVKEVRSGVLAVGLVVLYQSVNLNSSITIKPKSSFSKILFIFQ